MSYGGYGWEDVQETESIDVVHVAMDNGINFFDTADTYELRLYIGKFVSFQDEYSLACRKNEKDIGGLGQRVLTGKYNKDTKFTSDDWCSRDIYVNFHVEKFLKNLEIVEVMKEIAEKSLQAVEIRYILNYLSGFVVLCGVKRSSQIYDNVAGVG